MAKLGQLIRQTHSALEIVNTVEDLPGLKTHLRVLLVKNRGDGRAALFYWTPTRWEEVGSDVNTDFLYPKRYDLTSQIDGNRRLFTLPYEAVTDTLQVSLAGLIMSPGEETDNKDFTIINNTQIQFYFAPPVGANLLTYFIKES